MEFGERLKEARKKSGKTQEMVSKDLHVSRQTISSWETERSYPDINFLIQISDYYNLSLDTLLKEDIGMKEEMSRKEELAKINKIWGLSYAINLVLVAVFILSSRVELFQVSEGMQIALVIIMLLNASLLLFVKNEKMKLKQTKACFSENNKLIKAIFIIEIMLLIIAGIFTITTQSDQGPYFLGLMVGVLLASIALYLIKKILNRA